MIGSLKSCVQWLVFWKVVWNNNINNNNLLYIDYLIKKNK